MDHSISFRWLRTGDEVFAGSAAAIEAAQASVRLEIYTFTPSPIGEQFRQALIAACGRGIRVWVMVDGWGSFYLPDSFWDPLRRAGGRVRWFNPLSLQRFDFRDHRKLLVCDERVALVGGCNIAPEYEGDGVARGWRDLGIQLAGPLVRDLAFSFDVLFERADFRHKPFARFRKPLFHKRIAVLDGILLQSGPGRGFNPIKRSLRRDLARANSAKIITAYFLPTWGIRRELVRLARRGATVQLLLAGKTDVPMAQLAARRLYQKMLRAGIEVYEYQPQVLHAKLIVLDDVVYVGSANLDVRSLRINYELMLRLKSAPMAAEAKAIFAEALNHGKRIDPQTWKGARSFWAKLKERWAYFFLVRIDPYLALRQMRK
ncbi:MAG: cardiolipin synthase B [Candidatus Omnitrophica bacterium]|nr:cardiolipin synthase B [Candidatus Omnitrophota bacterium]